MEVRDKVKLLSYRDLDDLVQLYIRVEQRSVLQNLRAFTLIQRKIKVKSS